MCLAIFVLGIHCLSSTGLMGTSFFACSAGIVAVVVDTVNRMLWRRATSNHCVKNAEFHKSSAYSNTPSSVSVPKLTCFCETSTAHPKPNPMFLGACHSMLLAFHRFLQKPVGHRTKADRLKTRGSTTGYFVRGSRSGLMSAV